MVIRLVSVSDKMPLHEFHDVFRTILGWNGDLGYIVRVHGQEINSFRRKTRSKALHEFKLPAGEVPLRLRHPAHVGVGRWVGGRGAAQDFVVAQQAREELEQRRTCPRCRRRYTTKDSGSTQLARYSAELRCPIRSGTDAAARRRVPRRSVP